MQDATVQKGLRSLSIVVLVAVALVAFSTSQVHAAATGRLLIPSYFYPASDSSHSWTVMCNDASAQSIVILNPNSGPGTASDSTYVTAVKYCQRKDINVIGYVHTSYGARSITDVEAEIDEFYSWYGVDGIFLDEMSDDSSTLNYYSALHSYIHTKGSSSHDLDVGNMGTVSSTDWALSNNAVDILVIFEDSQSAFSSFTMPSWASSYPASDFAAIVYNVSSSRRMSSICSALSNTDKITYRYVTNLTLDNPYDALPSYWTTETSSC